MFTKEAYTWFQKLQFKNLLGKFDVEAAENEVEKAFREVTEQEEIERIFSEAKKAECVGAALIKCDGNVLPLFAHPSGYGRIALAYGKDQVYSIACSMDTDMDALFAQLSDVARSAGRFVMFDLKKYLPVLGAVCQKNCFDATVAAYLLNPLKNDYTYADVAREQLGLMIDDKADEWTKSCYEAYTAYAASENLMEKLKEEQMDSCLLYTSPSPRDA